MALISCPECERQVSDKAMSCPGCGYPLRQALGLSEASVATNVSEQPYTHPKDVLITGPNGIPLVEEVVKEFASFIEWVFDVELTTDDGDFIRQVLVEEWSRNDQLAAFFQITCTLLQQHFKLATRVELREEGHSDTLEYWRQALMRDLDLTGLGSLQSVLSEIAVRLKIETARNRLGPTSYIGSSVADLLVFITRTVHDIPGEGTPTLLTSYWEKTFADADNGDGLDLLIELYLMSVFYKEGWPQLSEADRRKVRDWWANDKLLNPMLETTRNALQQSAERGNLGHGQAPKSDNAFLPDVLVGRHWQARSHTLAGQGLVIAFMPGGEFSGQLTGASYTTPAQPIKGRWQVIEPQLFLDYVYNAQVDSGFTMQVIPTSAQIQIYITQASASKLLGVDQFARAWEWERIA